jgi:hypothetical protein
MKKIGKQLLLICCLWIVGIFTVQAQIGNITKQAVNIEKTALQNSLTSLDQQLLTQFKLDQVKSEIIGNVLKLKVADTDFAKLNASNQLLQGNKIMDAATKILSSKGTNLKSVGITKMVIEMLPATKATTILQTISRTL